MLLMCVARSWNEVYASVAFLTSRPYRSAETSFAIVLPEARAALTVPVVVCVHVVVSVTYSVLRADVVLVTHCVSVLTVDVVVLVTQWVLVLKADGMRVFGIVWMP